MAEKNSTNMPPRPNLPPLQQIEEEGQHAADELARAFVREAFQKGGRINLAHFERAGPTVQSAYRRMLGRILAQTLKPADPVPTRSAEHAAPPQAPVTPVQAEPPRAEKGWRDQRGPLPDFKEASRRSGYAAGFIVTAAALTAVFLLHL